MRISVFTCAALFLAAAPASPAAAADDAFSEIPLVTKLAPTAPGPKYTWPKPVARLGDMADPRTKGLRGFFGDSACGVSVISFLVSETGSVTDAKVSISSGFPHLDKASLNYVREMGQYQPATFEGRPLALWRLLPVNFSQEKTKCQSPESVLEMGKLSEEYSQPLKTLIEQAKAENAQRQIEQQRAIDEEERARFAVEEAYRLEKIPPGLAKERQAAHAAALYWNLVKCGNSYVGGDENFLIEYKNLRLYLRDVDTLSNIDKANGQEWRGTFGHSCEMQRDFRLGDSYQATGWSAWRTCDRGSTAVWKKNGKWHASGLYRDGMRPALSCATIPR